MVRGFSFISSCLADLSFVCFRHGVLFAVCRNVGVFFRPVIEIDMGKFLAV